MQTELISTGSTAMLKAIPGQSSLRSVQGGRALGDVDDQFRCPRSILAATRNLVRRRRKYAQAISYVPSASNGGPIGKCIGGFRAGVTLASKRSGIACQGHRPGSAEKSDRWRCDVAANLRLLLLAGINRREGLCSSSSLASQGG